jgi:RNA polymerase sigma-70 factor (ECF subfamily)
MMTLTPDLRDSILKTLPNLRAFALSLTGSSDQADDLVQEALVRGLAHLDQFQLGTNMEAWLFTILRNQFHTTFRKRRREVEDPDGLIAGRLSTLPEQGDHLDLEDLKIALTKLSFEQREALLLIASDGFSYEQAAQICGTRVGTIKSRINRARARLAHIMEIQEAEDIGSDRITKAVLHVV